MLQRAASNAYTWWWASHIRTKQSKWLENNLQDMEDMVTSMIKIIEEDADTFAKRAEMYYRKRPQLTDLVQETYKAYRALAERYDHLSGALQKANNTIATIFPDQHFGMDDEEDDSSTTEITADAPAARLDPYESVKSLREQIKGEKKKKKKKKTCLMTTKNEVEEEIDKLQKEILILQTEKEFIKCSYETGIARFWEKHKKITDMQERLSTLEEEFGEDIVIEDDEARALMAVTAVHSCVDTLVNLYEKRIRCMEDADAEYKRINIAKEKLGALRKKFGVPAKPDELNDSSRGASDQLSIRGSSEGGIINLKQRKMVLDSMCDEIRKNFKMVSDVSVLNIADKIDEHVSKVVTLETSTSSQVAQIQMLKMEIDDLYANLQMLEEEKLSSIHESSYLNDKLTQAEEEFLKIQYLEKTIQDESCKLQEQFTEAIEALNVLSERLQAADCGDEMESSSLISGIDGVEAKEVEEIKEVVVGQEHGTLHAMSNSTHNSVEEETCKIIECEVTGGDTDVTEESFGDPKQQDKVDETYQPRNGCNCHINKDHQEPKKVNNEQELRLANALEASRYNYAAKEGLDTRDDGEDNVDASSLNWREMFLNDLEDRERLLLAEYTSVLQDYKESKKKLVEADKRNQENMFQTMARERDFKNSIVMKDEEIRSLKQQLQFLQASWAENSDARVSYPEVDAVSIKSNWKESRSSSFLSVNSDALAPEISMETNVNQVTTNDGNPRFTVAEHLPSKSFKDKLDGSHSMSPIEDKFRRDIDQLLEDNLGFWLRFKSLFQQMQKYNELFRELESKITKLTETRDGIMTSNRENFLKVGATNLYSQLQDLRCDLSVWIEENGLMNGELHNRFSSLSSIEEEILRISKEGGGLYFPAYQALKFQGEIVNMRQENNQVAGELRAGNDHVRSLQARVNNLLENLDKKFELSSSKSMLNSSFGGGSFKSKIPLSVFLFGTKPKKPSLFACMNPVIQRQFSDLAASLHQ